MTPRPLPLVVLLTLVSCLLASSAVAAQRADAVLLVNSASTNYADAQQAIRPYLDHFGVPYDVLDIATTAVSPAIKDYALILIGHRGLDRNHVYLSAGEELNVSEAVRLGSGLVNFDNDLSPNGSTPRYQFIQDIFGFGYVQPPADTNVNFTAGAPSHYIAARHAANEQITTGVMTMAGIVLPPAVTSLANVGASSQTFLAVTTYGQGRAVQWGGYQWMSRVTKGPVFGLDDLVWRGFVWAARKPFVMQGLPNILTMRVDDAKGPFWWVDTANESNLKPWLGVFYQDISNSDATKLSQLVHAGKATASVHAKSDVDFLAGFFYFDHWLGGDYPGTTVTANFDDATAWHNAHDIPISKFVLAHYYQLGTNVFGRLQQWGVEFVGTQVSPGSAYTSSPSARVGPYRLYESGLATDAVPGTYADYVSVPGHPEFQNRFFNCVTEIRDDAGYEWYPDSNVTGTIGRGTRQVKRAFDSMALGTLFTHEQYVAPISPTNWSQELQGITANLAPYAPRSMTMDDACQYVRAVHTSNIASSFYDPVTRDLTANFSGSADITTQFYVFSDGSGGIVDRFVNAPAFTGSAVVIQKLGGPLDHVAVTPNPGQAPQGGQRQFTAQGYDADGVAIPGLYAWSIASGGTVDSNGLVTAGSVAGTFPNAVSATSGGITGSASLVVYAPVLDHFIFDPIAAPVYAGSAFPVTIRAIDQDGNPFSNYTGSAVLTDTTGTITPALTGSFTAGVWTGTVTIATAVNGVTIASTGGAATGTSGAFNVLGPQTVEVNFSCADDAHQSPVLPTTTDANALNATDGQWTEFWYQCCRPYAGVMAATGEANLGLPVMRFYADGLQNGTWEVRALLYTNSTGRDMRYFYGYTPDTPKALYVDTVGGAGGSEQHAEYSLGTVNITNGVFSIYVQDATLLSGTYPWFGWAKIRLIRQSSTGPLDHIVVTPGSASVTTGGTQQFTAQGYDASNSPMNGLTYTWSATAGGTINQSGLFAAGTTTGTFTNNVAAVSGGVTGYASTTVNGPALDHFGFDTISGTIYAGTPFGVRITAYDRGGNVLTTYSGQAQLRDTTGTITPTVTGSFASGAWLGNVTIATPATGVTITATDGTATGTSSAFSVLGRPDLVTTSVSNPPAAAQPGDSFQVSDTAANQGNASAGASTTRYYLSLDAVKNAGDVLLTGSRSVPSLTAAASSSGTLSITIPAGSALGVYYVLACADDTSVVTESNESNNCIASGTRLQLTRPDLRETSVSNPPATAAPGSGFQVTDTAVNQGGVPAGASTTRYYLSLDTVKDGGDVLLTGTRSVLSVSPGASSSGTVTVTVPSSTAASSYRLLACADDTTAVNESDESNNCIASASQVSVTRPDLVESTVSNPPATANAGAKFKVTDTARNQGNGSASSSSTRYYLSSDTVKSSGDVLLTGTRAVPTLAASASSSATVTVTIPTGTARGLYYLLACADDKSVVNESNESNNCSAAATRVQL